MTSTESILKAAETLFAERGYDRTPLLDIASLAGVAGGTIIYHFKSKERLLADLAVRHLRNLHTRCQDQASRGVNGLESVLLFLDAFHAYLRDHPHESTAYFRNLPGMKLDETLAQSIATAEQNLSILLECLLLLGMKDGSIRTPDMPSCVRNIRTMLRGGAHMILFHDGDAEAIARDALHCARLLLSGIASRSRETQEGERNRLPAHE